MKTKLSLYLQIKKALYQVGTGPFSFKPIGAYVLKEETLFPSHGISVKQCQ
jgi:hypothetical protein